MAADNPYIDPASGILRNKLGITSPKHLLFAQYIHARQAGERAAQYADGVANLDEAALKQVHHILFNEVYDWAGEPRKIPLSKGSIMFAPVRAMHGYADRQIFPKFKEAANEASDDDIKFAQVLAECWGELNLLHPFVEGNARMTMLFVNALAHRYGRDVDWRKVHPEEEISAAEAAMKLDYTGYTKLLLGAMRPWERGKTSTMHWPDRLGRT